MILIKKILENLLFWIVLVLTITVVSLIVFANREKNNSSQPSQLVSTAANSSKQLTTQDDWSQGSTLDDLDYISSAGSMKIDRTTSATAWDSTSDNGTDFIGDAGKLYYVTRLALYDSNWGWEVYRSDNGTDWTLVTDSGAGTGCGGGGEWYFVNFPARYMKVARPSGETCAEHPVLLEIETIPYQATHTSAASQITNTNLYQWQTFTPTYTQPANTTVSFRFRTSTDANTWTSWTAYQTPTSGSSLDITSLVTSKTGDAGSETFYKYIQVETRLTSSDGVSTPTVDSYSIGYHTNVPPDKPTGGTATAGN